MENTHAIPIQPLTVLGFAAYGQVMLHTASQPPDALGDGWRCWFPIGKLDPGITWHIGLVRSEPRTMTISHMERHLARAECVFALDRPLVQAVALSRSQPPDQPDPMTCAAFVLQPGQGVLMEKGVWHAVGMPAGDQAVVYSFALGEQPPDAQENSGWVPFAGGVQVELLA